MFHWDLPIEIETSLKIVLQKSSPFQFICYRNSRVGRIFVSSKKKKKKRTNLSSGHILYHFYSLLLLLPYNPKHTLKKNKAYFSLKAFRENVFINIIKTRMFMQIKKNQVHLNI